MKKFSDHKDIELIQRLNLSDAASFTVIYNKYWKFLYTIAYKKLNQTSEAEEVVQDIFLDLWNRRNSLEISTSLYSYLSVAVNYRVFKVLARRQLYIKYKNSGNLRTDSIRMEPLLEFEEVKERLFRLVAMLPEKCRLVFKMSRDEDMSCKEIARHLKISEKTVEAHLTKALHHLKTGLGILSIICIFFL